MNLNRIYELILSQSENKNNPKILLKELLEVYNFLYSKLGMVAVQYGNGTHPKHRLTKYHDFFVENVDENESVLDLGSGRGDVTYDVANKTDAQVIGIEINPNNIAYAKKTYTRNNLKFIQGDLRNNLTRGQYDVVILSNVLEHLDNRVNILHNVISATQCKKVLLRIPYFEREWTVPMKKELGVVYFLDKTHKIEYTHEEFYSEIEQADLDVISATFKWGEIWAVCKPKE